MKKITTYFYKNFILKRCFYHSGKLNKRYFLTLLTGATIFFNCAGPQSPESDDGPSPARSPEEELASFQLDPDLQIQLVAAEPMVQDPVVITFDEDGRLWVVEMRGFMPDIDGAGEKERVGRVSVLEDTDGDGVMDVSTIYIDSLILPRAIAIVPGGALIVENQALWLTEDFDHDLKADAKTLIDPDYAGGPLVEHSGNGLWRGLDNWYYNAKSRFRYRLTDGGWQRDSTEFRGQWGISHDDEGRLYYNYNWSQLHADLVPPNYLSRNKNHKPTTGIDHGLTIDRRVYPIRANPATNRGYIPGTLDESGRLLEFTAACSPLFYRGNALPSIYAGSVFVCEPSGNLIKRNVVEEAGALLAARDPNPGREFLASTDERFRPVQLATGPDGALYVADMYRGLVQHGPHVTPYLREQTISRKLVLPIHLGRIWRIVPKDWKAPAPTELSAASSVELVGYLSNPNGWYRDMAQKLLVERNDKSIQPALIELSLHGDNHISRLHGLWTMEGLKILEPDLLFRCLTDKNEIIRTTALRLLEPMAKSDPNVRAKLETEIFSTWNKASFKEILQIALTAEVLNWDESRQLLAGIVERYDSSALVRDAVLSSLQNREFTFLQDLRKSTWRQKHTPDKEIFVDMLTSAIVRKRDTKEMTGLLSILDKDDFTWVEKAMLTAIAIQGRANKSKPIVLTSQPGILSRQDISIEQSRLQELATIFEWPGHTAAPASLRQSQLTEADQQKFALGRQLFLTSCAGCHGTDGAGLSRFAPTLIGSDWVLGNEKRLALLILHGIEGPVEVAGKVYDIPDILPAMPAHSPMDDGAITAIMTYIRNEWGNNAGPVSKRIVGDTRHTSQGRVVPWTANELNKHIVETEPAVTQ